MPVTNTYHFTRRSDSDYHPTLDVSLTNSVSYSLFNGPDIVAALITNNGKTVAQFIGEGRYTIHSSGFFLSTVKRRFTTEDNETYAEIIIKRPFFGKDKYQVHFPNEECHYTFQYNDIKPGTHNDFSDFKADLLKDGQIACSIKNFAVKERLFDPRTNYLEGEIELYEGHEKEKVFVLIQTLQLSFELDMLL